MPTKTRLFDMLARARDEELNFISSLSLEERTAQGSIERWSAKDIIAHLAFMRGLLAHRLSMAAAGQEPEPIQNQDELYTEVYQANYDRTWDEVLADSERTFQSLIVQMNKFSNEDISNPDRYAWRKGRPVWQLILAPGYIMPYYRLALFYVSRGDIPRANFLQEQVAESLNQMENSNGWHSRTYYNLGCFYAITGQQDRSVSRLQEAFNLNPLLRDVARQDRDLLSLHHVPAFQALLVDQTGIVS